MSPEWTADEVSKTKWTDYDKLKDRTGIMEPKNFPKLPLPFSALPYLGVSKFQHTPHKCLMASLYCLSPN